MDTMHSPSYKSGRKIKEHALHSFLLLLFFCQTAVGEIQLEQRAQRDFNSDGGKLCASGSSSCPDSSRVCQDCSDPPVEGGKDAEDINYETGASLNAIKEQNGLGSLDNEYMRSADLSQGPGETLDTVCGGDYVNDIMYRPDRKLTKPSKVIKQIANDMINECANIDLDRGSGTICKKKEGNRETRLDMQGKFNVPSKKPVVNCANLQVQTGSDSIALLLVPICRYNGKLCNDRFTITQKMMKTALQGCMNFDPPCRAYIRANLNNVWYDCVQP